MEIGNLIFQGDSPGGDMADRRAKGHIALTIVWDFAVRFPDRLVKKADVEVGGAGTWITMQVYFTDTDDLMAMRKYVDQELFARGLRESDRWKDGAHSAQVRRLTRNGGSSGSEWTAA